MAGPFAAAVFDLDGTLIDSEERSREAWLHVFKTRGLPADEELIRSFIGRRGVDTREPAAGPAAGSRPGRADGGHARVLPRPRISRQLEPMPGAAGWSARLPPQTSRWGW